MGYRPLQTSYPAVLVLLLGLALLVGAKPAANPPLPRAEIRLTEQPVLPLPLRGPITDPTAEISGMAWYGDYLVMLPQYPERFVGEDGPQLFVLPKSAIVEALNDPSVRLDPIPLSFTAPDFRTLIPGFQGFEAIGFAGSQVFLTIEAESGTTTAGYLVRGQVVGDLESLVIESGAIATIPSQSGLSNMAEESLLVAGNEVLTFHEVNGAALNPTPVAHRFSFDLEPRGTVPFPSLEYRVTDATAMEDGGRFWVMNYFYAGDRHLKPSQDPYISAFGLGQTHAQHETVERLVALAYDGERITPVPGPPILLTLEEEGRNWEAIVRLDDQGFLVMTDKFPGTVLGFVVMP